MDKAMSTGTDLVQGNLRLGAPAFSNDEYRARLKAVQAELREREADFLLADSFEHLGYITGFMPGGSVYQVAIVPADGDPVMILRRLDEPTFAEQSWVKDYATFADHEDPTQILTAKSKRGDGNARPLPSRPTRITSRFGAMSRSSARCPKLNLSTSRERSGRRG